MREISELNFRINFLRAMASVSDAELARKSAEIAQKESDIVNLVDELSRKDDQLASRDDQIVVMERTISELLANQKALLSSTSWRITAVVRWLGQMRRKPSR